MSLLITPARDLVCTEEIHKTDAVKSGEVANALTIPRILLIGAAIFYCVAVLKIAVSKEPFIDEGWMASPAYNLAFHGFMGTTVLEPTGSWLNGDLRGIRQYTYWVMPLHILAQAAWYRIFGFGLTQMRLMSAVWGAIALVAWYFIVDRIAKNPLASSLTVFLLSLDFTFLWSASDGRMDMMCVGLGSAALATYLLLREDHFEAAFFFANCLAAASVFTHPNGVVWICFLGVLVLLYDRKNIGPALLAAALPYAVLAVGWLWYIAKRPDYFLAQFSANLHIPGATRGSGLLHPLLAIANEGKRYWKHFSAGIWAQPVPFYAILIPALLWTMCIAALIRFLKTRNAALGTILLLLAVCLGFMTFGDSLKAHNYLGMIMPIYAATIAVWFSIGEFKGRGFYVRCGLIVLLLGVQVDVLNAKVFQNARVENFDSTVALLKSMPSAKITGSSVFAFSIDPSRINDDMRLGMRSGTKPDVIVADRWYYMSWGYFFPQYDPEAAIYVKHLLDSEYVITHGRGDYVVYERKASLPQVLVRPAPLKISAHNVAASPLVPLSSSAVPR